MFIGHLPAGYLLTKVLQKKLKTTQYFVVGLIGSIFPDFDIFYFYFIDQRQNSHHSYWIHIPIYWLIIATVTCLLLWFLKKKDYFIATIIFFSNVFLHLILDTIVGKIAWLLPLTEKVYYIFDVPDRHDFWVYNFIFHWTFVFEIAIIALAIYVFVKSRRNRSK